MVWIIIRVALFVIMLLIFPPWKGGGRVYAQRGWGPAGCAPVGAKVQSGWVKTANGKYAWYTGGAQTGLYDPQTGLWCDWDDVNKEWLSDWKLPPWDKRKPEAVGEPKETKPLLIVQTNNHGLVNEKINQSKTETFWLGEKKVCQTCYDRALATSVPDDSKKAHITVVCPDAAKRQGVAEALAKDPRIAANAQVHSYDPEDKNAAWALEMLQLDRDRRYQKSKFLTLLQTGVDPKSGDAKSKLAWYKGEPEEIRLAVDRKIDPGYDPNKVPDANAKAPGHPRSLLPYGLMAGGIGAAVYFSRKKVR